jgi:allantoicase
MGKNKKETEPTITSTITKWKDGSYSFDGAWYHGFSTRRDDIDLPSNVTSMSVQDGRANQKKTYPEIRQVSPRLT